MEKRGTIKQMYALDDVIKTIAESAVMSDLWLRYQKKYGYATDVTWAMVVEALGNLRGEIKS